MSKPPLIWMPYKEYIAQKELFAKLEPKIIHEMTYFMWNNFSMEGYKPPTINKDKLRALLDANKITLSEYLKLTNG